MFYSTLLEAVKKEDLDDIIFHLNNGSDVNKIDENDKTALHIAIDLENAEIVELLVNFKADLSLRNISNDTPLLCAVYKSNFNIIKLLVDAGADIYTQTISSRSPLNTATGNNNVSMVKFFLSHNAPGENIDSLSLALNIACENGSLEMIKILIDAGAMIIPQDKNWDTGLHVAARNNNIELLEFLLSYEVDIDIKARDGQTALHRASMANEAESHIDIIQKLLDLGVNVNLQDNFDITALHYAVIKKNVETVRLLLKLVSHRIETTLFIDAVETGKIELMRLLVDYGSDVNCINLKNGRTPLHYVNGWAESSYDLVKYLMKNGAKIDAADFNGSTALLENLKYHRFNREISRKMLKFLLDHCDVNVINSKGENVATNLKTYGRVWKMVLGHLAKLQALKIPVHPSLLNTIQNNAEFEYYFNKCAKELLLAKNTKPHNSWITYFDLLVANKRMLKNYAGNKELVNDFENSDLSKKFRIYGECMKKNVSKGMKKRKLFDESTVLLYNSLPIFDPTHLIIRDILDNLTTSDLSKLVIEEIINVTA